MRHIEKFQIHQFRGVRDLKLEGLGQVNLLVGGNNSGKTSVLEAIELHCHPFDPLRLVVISKMRDAKSVHLPRLDSLQWLFPVVRGDGNSPTKLSEITMTAESRQEIIQTFIQCNETKVMEMVPENRYGLHPLVVEGLQKNTQGYVKESNASYQANGNMTDSWQKRVIQDDIYQLGEKEVRAFDISFSYVYSDLESGGKGVSKSNLTVTNHSLIKQNEIYPLTIRSTIITPTDHHLLPVNSEISNAILSGDQLQILELLQLFDENVENLQILAPDGLTPVPYLTHRKFGPAPVSIFGDGIRRALTLASAVVNCANGILLIDEVETAIHVGALDKVFTWLVKACKLYNVQLFATTHSLEAIDAILAVFLESKEVKENSENWQEILQNFVTYRLVPKGDTTVVKRFAGDALADIRYDFGQDVR